MPKMHAAPEVEKVQEVLKSSSMELQAAVKRKRILTMTTNNRSSKSPVVNQPGLETHTPPEAGIDNDKENAEKKENPAQDLHGNEAHQGMKILLHIHHLELAFEGRFLACDPVSKYCKLCYIFCPHSAISSLLSFFPLSRCLICKKCILANDFLSDNTDYIR